VRLLDYSEANGTEKVGILLFPIRTTVKNVIRGSSKLSVYVVRALPAWSWPFFLQRLRGGGRGRGG